MQLKKIYSIVSLVLFLCCASLKGYAQTQKILIFNGNNFAAVQSFVPEANVQQVSDPNGLRLRLHIKGKIKIALIGFYIIREGKNIFVLDPSDFKKNLTH